MGFIKIISYKFIIYFNYILCFLLFPPVSSCFLLFPPLFPPVSSSFTILLPLCPLTPSSKQPHPTFMS